MIFQLFKIKSKEKCAFDCIWNSLDARLMEKFFNFIDTEEKLFAKTKLFLEIEKLKNDLVCFFHGRCDSFKFNSKLNKYQKNIHYQVLMKSFDFSEISLKDLRSDNRVDFHILEDLLNSSPHEKYEHLNARTIKSPIVGHNKVSFIGTDFYDGCFIRCVTEKGFKFYIISVETPIDVIFIPSLNLLINADNFRFSSKGRVERLFKGIMKDIDFFFSSWTNQRIDDLNVNFVIRNKRPYHVVAESLYSYYDLFKNKNMSLIVNKEGTFLDFNKLFPDRQILYPLEHSDFQNIGINSICFTSCNRLRNDERGGEYKDFLKSKSSVFLNKETTELLNSSYVVWLCITSGEKRYWIEETETLVSAIKYYKKSYDNIYFIFDGYTGTKNLDENVQKNIDYHLRILDEIIDKTSLETKYYKSLIGSEILEKIAYAKHSNFFISAGTPLLWISKICGIPGIVHGNNGMINISKLVIDDSNVVKVQQQHIKEIGIDKNAKKERWDFVNYSIGKDTILSLIKKEEK